MITEEMLCAAAARSCEIYVSYLERGYTPENQHEFSLQFEKKIKKLKNYSILVDIYLMFIGVMMRLIFRMNPRSTNSHGCQMDM